MLSSCVPREEGLSANPAYLVFVCDLTLGLSFTTWLYALGQGSGSGAET